MISEVVASHKFGIGIDPGWKNLGFAIVKKASEDEPIELVYSSAINPSTMGIVGTVNHISKIIDENVPMALTGPRDNVKVCIERYVPYNNVVTTESETITMMVGALMVGTDYYTSHEVRLFRAIDWKMNIVKALFKQQGFQNPSDKLDKKFSIAAAKAVANVKEIKTDHEADAICLAGLPFILDF
jgi:Holliday junction resolvasome RuvABC endonuclease subunit